MTALLLGLRSQYLVPIILGGAALVGMFFARRSGVKSERNRNRAKEADAYEKSLKEIADAADARNSVRADSVPEHDPYRRD